MRTEISQARKENQFFLSSVEQSKALKKIENRKRKRGEEMDFTGIRRTYKQSKIISNDDAGPSSSLPDELLLKVCNIVMGCSSNQEQEALCHCIASIGSNFFIFT